MVIVKNLVNYLQNLDVIYFSKLNNLRNNIKYYKLCKLQTIPINLKKK